MKSGTYPVGLADPSMPSISKLPILIPKKEWEGDFLVDLDNDIKFLANHFQAQPGSYLWVRETHRLSVKTNVTDPSFSEVWAEYKDGERRKTTLLPNELTYMDRWIPPVAMLRDACRFVLKVRDIEVMWSDDVKTKLIWAVGVEKMAAPDYIIDQDKRGVLQ